MTFIGFRCAQQLASKHSFRKNFKELFESTLLWRNCRGVFWEKDPSLLFKVAWPYYSMVQTFQQTSSLKWYWMLDTWVLAMDPLNCIQTQQPTCRVSELYPSVFGVVCLVYEASAKIKNDAVWRDHLETSRMWPLKQNPVSLTGKLSHTRGQNIK